MSRSLKLFYFILSLETYASGHLAGVNMKSIICAGKTVSCIEDAPGWEEFLASDSEAVVKAERSKNKSMKEMQEDTVHYLKEEDECDAASAAAAAPQPSK